MICSEGRDDNDVICFWHTTVGADRCKKSFGAGVHSVGLYIPCVFFEMCL